MTMIELQLIVTPVITIFGKKARYRLMDSAYGEWLVYDADDNPVYYLNVFDPDYNIGLNPKTPYLESYLEKILVDCNSNLKLSSNIFGIPLTWKSEVKKISLQKMPLKQILSA